MKVMNVRVSTAWKAIEVSEFGEGFGETPKPTRVTRVLPGNGFLAAVKILRDND
jgi:hypothetical protein